MEVKKAGTEIAKPLTGALAYTPAGELDIAPLHGIDGVMVQDGRIIFGTIEGEIALPLKGRKEPLRISRVTMHYDSQEGEKDEAMRVYKIDYPDYDEEGDPEVKTVMVGGREFPSIRIGEIGVFTALRE